jgi:hypothetical protein
MLAYRSLSAPGGSVLLNLCDIAGKPAGIQEFGIDIGQ